MAALLANLLVNYSSTQQPAGRTSRYEIVWPIIGLMLGLESGQVNEGRRVPVAYRPWLVK